MRTLLARIKADHPKAAALRSAAERCIEVAERYAATKAEKSNSGKLTAAGMAAELRDALPGYAAQLEAARGPISKLAREAKERRAAIKIKEPDPANLTAAIERMETRTFLRSMEPGERAGLLASTRDKRILEAALTAPPELSGLTGNLESLAKQVEDRYLEMTHGPEAKAVSELEDVVAEATAVALVARGKIQSETGMSAREFDNIAGPAEKAAAPVWLFKNIGTDGVERTWVREMSDDQQRAVSHRPATAYELEHGEHYADFDAYRASRGLAE
jgi:hypothetical protein